MLHHCEVLRGDDVLAAGDRDEDVAVPGGLVHGHDPEAVHGGVQGLEGVHLGDDDAGPHAGGPHGHPLAAPAVPGHHHGLARHHQVGGVHDGVPNRLAGAVLVVIVVLGLGVVDGHHGAGQNALPLPGLKAQDAGGGLLAAADEVLAQVGALAAQQVDQIAAVIHHQMGLELEGLDEEVLILLPHGAVDAESLHAHVGQSGGHVVLGGQGVGAGEAHLRPALGEHIAQVGGLGLQVDGHRHPQAGEGLLLLEAGLNAAQGGHEVPHPVDLPAAGRGQVLILYNTHAVPPCGAAAEGLGPSQKSNVRRGLLLRNSCTRR